MEFRNKKVLVVGFGQSGSAAGKLLLSEGAEVFVTMDGVGDSVVIDAIACAGMTFLPKEKAEEMILAREFFSLVISPSISVFSRLPSLARLSGTEVLSELELGWQFCKGKTIAITGTNGKTTSVTLLTEILKKAGFEAEALGNIGKPFCTLAKSMGENSFAVVEASSFQLESVLRFKPDYAAILNIGMDHMDRHRNLDEYIKSKHNVFKNMDFSSALVLNCVDEKSRESVSKNKYLGNVFYFSKDEFANGAFCIDDNIFFGITQEYIMKKSELKLIGEHNLENVLAVITLAKILKVENEVIRESVSEFVGIEHRLQFVRELDGVKYFNDSKGTNINSTLQAVRAMKGKTVLILGGSDKGYEYDELFHFLPEKVVGAVAFGETKQKIFEAGKREGFSNISLADSLKESVLLARFLAKCGDNVLLSPASASFDMYRSYVERGNSFIEIVKGLS